MVVLGYQDTTDVTLDEMLHHTRAAARGVKQALLVADMPIHTYETPRQAVETAKKFVDAGAQAVKLEGGLSHVAHIEAITDAGVPFMAHIGMLPQSVREQGGYRIKGRTQSEVEALLADARAVEEAGAFSVVLEIVLADVAKQITNTIGIPTIGIGSGDQCDGQILVTHDLIGLFPWFTRNLCRPKRVWRRKFGALCERSSSEHAAVEEFHKHPFSNTWLQPSAIASEQLSRSCIAARRFDSASLRARRSREL